MSPRSSSAGSSPARRRRSLRLLVVLAVVASVLFAAGTGAVAVQVPATLADQRPAQLGPVAPGFTIDFLGVVWDTDGLPSAAAGGAEPSGAVRFRHGAVWGPWMPLVQDSVQAPGLWTSTLVPAGDADAYQVRGLPWGALSPRVAALNTTDGPPVTVGRRPSGAVALSDCVSRAEWGADESLRFVAGTESWPPLFEPVRVMTVHHTVTANNDADPAATVRAIYYYHAVTNGWGDIAYHYLIDEAGRVYEGRWSGEESLACSAGGDGTDFGHDAAGSLVTAGHTYCYNRGNLGVALLGDFTRVLPKAAARAALEGLLAENATRHGLDPLGTVYYEAPSDMTACAGTPDASIEAIAAHTDWPDPAGATSCPGTAWYPQMPSLRSSVALLMGLEVPAVVVGEVTYGTTVRRGVVQSLSVTITLAPPLSGAGVSATVSGPATASKTGVTDGAGSLVITVRKPKRGCYSTLVTGVSAAGFDWDGLTPANGYCF